MFKDRKRKLQAARRNVKKLLQDVQSRHDSDSSDSVNKSDECSRSNSSEMDRVLWVHLSRIANVDSAEPIELSCLTSDEKDGLDEHENHNVLWDAIDGLSTVLSSDEEVSSDSLVNDLVQWQSDNAIPKCSLRKLLKILRKQNIDVPADADTVVCTPRTGAVQVITKSGGNYKYLGLEKGIKRTFKKLPNKDLHDVIELSEYKTRKRDCERAFPAEDPALKKLPGKRKGKLRKTSLSSDDDDDDPAKKVCKRMTTKAKTNKTGNELEGYDSEQEVGFSEAPTYSGGQRISNGKQSSKICSKESSDAAVLTSTNFSWSSDTPGSMAKSKACAVTRSTSARPSPITTPKLNDARPKSHPVIPSNSGHLSPSEKTASCKARSDAVPPSTSDMCVLILRKLEKIEQNQESLMTDIARLKAVLIKRIPDEEDRTELLAGLQKFTDVETFEAFCTKVEKETNFRTMFVNHCIQTYGSKDIGDAVRSILKAIMSDELMVQYNRTGIHGKKLFPSIFFKCISKCVRHFHKDNEVEVRRGKETTKTTIDLELAKQVEIYLSNAKTRIKRQEAKLTKAPDSLTFDSDLY